MSTEQTLTYEQFHDGSFDGLLIDGDTVRLFLSTLNKVHYVCVGRGVLALSVDEIMLGNIILEIGLRPASEVTVDELNTRAQMRVPYSSAGIGERLLEKAPERKLTALTIDPWYGATCLVFGESFELSAA